MSGRLYDKRRWHRVRKRKMAAHPVCEGCEARPTQHVDHMQPIDKGGAPFDPANLMALCIDCHNGKTAADKTGKQWLPPKHRGCDVNGFPLMGGGVPSLQSSA